LYSLYHIFTVSPVGIALDWLSRKIYWCDEGTKRIEVATLDGSLRSLLIWEGLNAPNSIAVAPGGNENNKKRKQKQKAQQIFTVQRPTT